MTIDAIHSDAAPRAIGPYSQAVAAGGLVFCSGQIALDPTSGQLVGAGDVRLEVAQVLENLEAVLAAAGLDLRAVVKTTIFLVDLADFGAVNELYGQAIARSGGVPPARATVQVAGLPKGALVEIDAVAVRS